MRMVVLGINHKTAHIDLREKFYLKTIERELLLSELKLEPLVAEALVLSTCNRTEIYAVMSEPETDRLLCRLHAVKNIRSNTKELKCFYHLFDDEAVLHFLKVATGLDSLVIGERQILGQLKAAVVMARDKGTLGRSLNILSNIAIRAGKKAQTETQISCGGSSTSWAAVEMAKKIFSTLEGRSVLIIGAGKMSQLAAGDFKRKGVGHLYVMNRTADKGVDLAKRFGGEAVNFWEMSRVFEDIDVCICSASAPHYLIEKELVERAMKGRERKLLLIDISIPRNIDPASAGVKGVELITIDQLDGIVEENTQARMAAVSEVEEIVRAKMQEYHRKIAAVRNPEEGAFAHLLVRK